MEMVLGDPGGIVAVRFGVGDLFGGQAIALRGRRCVEQAGEEGEALEVRGAWSIGRSYASDGRVFNGSAEFVGWAWRRIGCKPRKFSRNQRVVPNQPGEFR